MAAALDAHIDQQVELGEEEDDDFNPIEKLQALGVAAADIKKAKEGGFHTCESLLMNTKKKLANIKGLSDAKVDKLVEASRKVLPGAGWLSGTTALQRRQREIVRISTGSQALNDILGGGVETKSLTEVYGEYRTGKTQLCMTLCVTTQLPIEDGGGSGKVAYIDAEGTFRPERITPIAERFGLDPDAVLDNIAVARSYTHEHMHDLLVGLAAQMVEHPFKLIIIDSLMSHFKVDFTGRGELAERQQKLAQMCSSLKKLAEEFNVAVVYTNTVMSDPGGAAMFVADPKKPAGGHVLAHASTVRISLRKGKAEQRVAKVVVSPCMPEAEASFQLGASGVEEYKD